MSKKEPFPPDCFELGHQSFPAFRLKLKHWLFLGVELTSFWTGTVPSALLGLQFADYRYLVTSHPP